MNTQDRPAVPQQQPGDDDLEPRLPRGELREMAVSVIVTLGLAAAIAATGAASSGVPATVLLLAAPAVVLIGALVTGSRAYGWWRTGGHWQIWQGGMWLLLVIFLVWVMTSIGIVLAE
ncbi:hypothetical protein MYK68_04610 [Gordonia sp. PP30]|uniref:hypothetical protein n=1 Tax=Gordonia sp. PP30 TaxID=2935861 RepID=UPI001FFF1770|nr:hypothetical protein [Gordonia sp. PP30]UQE75892.1 hypothetical protein MYK68_04610 [Gordonia sp. PP30]